MPNPTESEGETEIATVSSADGAEIAYERSGSGPPLVLVHGAIFDRTIWELGDVRSRLAEHATVYAMDRRDHGDSESSNNISPDAQFDDVVAVVESIDDPVHLLGHSSGADYALGAAPRIDNLRSLILHGPSISPGDDEAADELEAKITEIRSLLDEGQTEQALTLLIEEVAHYASDEVDAIRSAPIWDAHVDTFRETFLGLLAVEYEYDITRFEDLTTPTLFLTGSESGRFKERTETLHEMLPNSRLTILEGHGHAAYFVAPDRYTDEVLSFINEIE